LIMPECEYRSGRVGERERGTISDSKSVRWRIDESERGRVGERRGCVRGGKKEKQGRMWGRGKREGQRKGE